MKVAVLFSGGKDSSLALHHALQKGHEVKCLINIVSENPASYMFHTPNIKWAEKQAQAIGLPLVIGKTKGEKELELEDLEKAIEKAKKKFNIKGIVTGAVASVYQSSRIQKICDKLRLKCINPLWQKNQFDVLNEIVDKKFEVLIIGVYGLGMENFLGRKIDAGFIEDIKKAWQKYGVNVAGEGGEFESFVLNAPFFKKRILIEKSHIVEDKEGGRTLVIDKLKII
ncbi:TIGR00289 family protein [Candidatus Pacearchaeota archaeon CG06_land_8_20_14_3_00_35_12]|nr:MAG: TIGR00289 family protein [Candidatus Pacearchaeota archaeon CG06_land_8_20_14_3_00_35_12]